MPNLDYPRLVRFLSRSREMAATPGMDANVVTCYSGVLDSPSTAFLAAHKEVTRGESAYVKEREEATAALDALDQPYRVARSMVMAFVPTVKLPSTLRSLYTDTDKLNAIEALLDVLTDHASEGWADAQLKGEFGTWASAAIKELGESIAASRDLDLAQKARASAFGPAYDAYLRFKRVVRHARGANSKDYRRIHMRSSSLVVSEEDETSAVEQSSED